jgi:hypothetical protein
MYKYVSWSNKDEDRSCWTVECLNINDVAVSNNVTIGSKETKLRNQEKWEYRAKYEWESVMKKIAIRVEEERGEILLQEPTD